jgi:4-phosphopantoate--beta-alanine ligase
MTRNRIVSGVEKGITSLHGLVAQGRGEAFDYLIGEKTHPFADSAIKAAAAMLLLAHRPVISVNGNVATLASDEIVSLHKNLPARLEVNIFHASRWRERKIRRELLRHGAEEVLIPSKKYTISSVDHNRKYVNREGIFKADVVFVPLEDGDRCEALVASHKKVITIDLNPFSRTAKTATITIVDNLVRALPLLLQSIKELKGKKDSALKQIVSRYDNKKILRQARKTISKNLEKD